MPLRTVAAEPTCGTQVTADLLACGTMMFAMGDRAELVDRARHRVGRSAAT
jgi:hypothetical protein